jgi:hypothetical protein
MPESEPHEITHSVRSEVMKKRSSEDTESLDERPVKALRCDHFPESSVPSVTRDYKIASANFRLIMKHYKLEFKRVRTRSWN